MNKITAAIVFLFYSVTGWASVINDGFNREAGPASEGLGKGWVSTAATDLWCITDGILWRDTVTSADPILYNNLLTTTSGSTNQFTVSGDVVVESGYWNGVVFNYQNPSNFYAIRIKGGTSNYQFLMCVNGVKTAPINKTDAISEFAGSASYTITVSSDAECNYDFTIQPTGGNTVLNPVTHCTDDDSNFAGGYAGFYGAGPGGIDNFNLEKIQRFLMIDGFDRSDTGYTADGSDIGPDWVNAGADQWEIKSGVVWRRVATSTPQVLYNTSAQTASGDWCSFEVRANCWIRSGSWAGLVFNYQNSSNFYAIRVKGDSSNYQFLRYINGVADAALNAFATNTFTGNSYHTITVKSDAEYGYDITIQPLSGSTVLTATNVVDSASNFTGGYAGFYTVGNCGMDNFKLAVSGYESWAGLWGVDIGTATDDYDHDGLSNIYEYGVSSDPTSAINFGMLSLMNMVNVNNSNYLQYIHPQRSSLDSGVTYSLASCTDLLQAEWDTDPGCEIVGTNVTGRTFNFVTNLVDMASDQKYIRLLVQ